MIYDDFEPRSRIASLLGRNITLWHAGWVCVLAGLGLSLLGIYGIDLAGERTPPESTLVHYEGRTLKQAVYLGIGLVSAFVVALPRYRLLRFVAWPLLALMIGLLVFVLIPFVPSSIVSPRNGARSWINLGVADFQPSEIAKVAYVLVMAEYLRFRTDHRELTGLAAPALITFVPVALITLQPDLGTACLFVPALFAMLMAAGARKRHLVTAVTVAALAGPAAYPLLKPHQKERIRGLVLVMQGSREGADDINFQSLTAMTLIGAGGVTGTDDATARSLVHYNALPEGQTDMVFAVLVNRFGLVGGLGIVGLYGLWMLGAIVTATVCKDGFGRLVVVGCAAVVSAQVVINVGMNLGVVPIIGITLPFVSYGGSSILTVWLMTGLVVNVASRRPVPPFRPAFEYAEDHG